MLQDYHFSNLGYLVTMQSDFDVKMADFIKADFSCMSRNLVVLDDHLIFNPGLHFDIIETISYKCC